MKVYDSTTSFCCGVDSVFLWPSKKATVVQLTCPKCLKPFTVERMTTKPRKAAK